MAAIEEDRELSDLMSGPAFVDLSGWAKTEVTGTDARKWLGDLVTSNIQGLEPGAATRSLLLTPTGRIRFDFWVACLGDRPDRFMLLADTRHQNSPATALDIYVLSSDVTMRDVTTSTTAVAISDGRSVQLPSYVTCFSPAPFTTGIVALADEGHADALRGALEQAGLHRSTVETMDRWMTALGLPRVGVDFQAGALPAECGAEGAIDATKGCFLGQESVAKVRNLGHPPSVLLRLRSESPLIPGQTLTGENGSEVGRVTSCVFFEGAYQGMASVLWSSRQEKVTTPDGQPVTTFPLPAGV